MAGELDKLEYLLQVKVEGQESVDRAAQSFKPVGANASSAASSVDQLTQIIQTQTRAGTTLASVLENVTKGAGLYSKELRQAAAATLVNLGANEQLVRSYLDVGKAAEEAARKQQQAAAKAAAEADKAAAQAEAASQRMNLAWGRVGGNALFGGGGANGAAGLASAFGGGFLGGFAATAAVSAIRQLVRGIEDLTVVQATAARESVNFADRLGLSVIQARNLENVARLAGVGVTGLEGGMRILSNALEDSTGRGKVAAEALARLGVSTVTSSGDVKEMGPVLLDLLNKLSQIPSAAERMRESTVILGRGAKEIEPLIQNFGALQAVTQEYGLGLDENVIRKNAEAAVKFDALGIAWDRLKQKLTEKIDPIIIPIVESVTRLAGGNGEPEKPRRNKLTGGGPLFDFTPGATLFDPQRFLHGEKPAPSWANELPAPAPPPGSDSSISAFVKSLSGQGNYEDELRKRAAKAKQDYEAEVTKGENFKSKDVTDSARDTETKKINGLRVAYERLNAQLTELETHKRGVGEIDSFVERMTRKTEGPVASIFSEAHGLIDRGHLRGADADRVWGAAYTAVDNELAKQSAEWGGLTPQQKLSNAGIAGLIPGPYGNIPSGLITPTNILPPGLQMQKMQVEGLSGSAKFFDQRTAPGLKRWDDDTAKSFQEKARLAEEFQEIKRNGQRQTLLLQGQREQRLGALRFGPGDENRAIDFGYQQRMKYVGQYAEQETGYVKTDTLLNGDKQRNELAKIRQTVEKQTADAQLEAEEKLLELQHKRIEEAEKQAHQIAGALLTRGGMRDFVRDQAHGFEQQVLGNVLTPVVQQIGAFGGSAAGGQRDANGNLNWWGKTLQGTFLADKGTTNLPLDRNTISTDENTKAMVALTGKIAPGSTDQGTAASGQGATPSSGDLPAAASGPGAGSGRQWMGTTLPGAGSSAYSNLITPAIFGALGASTGNALATEFEPPSLYTISQSAAKTWKPPLFAHPMADIAGGAAGVATGIGMDFWKPHGTQGTAGSAAGNPLLAVQNQALAHLENIDASVSGNRNNGTTGLNTNLAGVGGIPIVNSGGAPALQSGAGDVSANPFLAPLGMDAWSPDGTAFGGAASGGARGGSDLSGMPSGTEAWSPAAMAPLISSSLKQAGALGGPLSTTSAYGTAAQFAGPVASGTTGTPINVAGVGGIPIVNSGGVPSLQSAAGSDYSSDLSSNPFLAPLGMDAWSPASTAFGDMSSTASAYGTGMVPDLSAPEATGAGSDLSDLPLSMSSWSPLPIAGPGLSDLDFGASIPLVSAGGLSGVTSSAFTSQLSQFSKALSTVSGGGGAASLWDAMSGAAGRQTGPGVGQAFTPASQAGTIVGGLGTIAAGTLSAISQFSKGGVRGDLGGTSAILNTAGTLAGGPTNPIGMALDAGGMVTGLISALLPNPREAFAKATNLAQQQESFIAPPTINRTVDTNGNNVAYDSLGHPYSTTSQGYSVTEPYKTYFNGNYTTVPGYSLQNYSSPAEVSPGSVYGPTYSTPGSSGMTLQMSVQALDSKSILDRSSDIGAAVLKELQQGGALGQRVQSTVLGS